jgi:hypothetical protein
MFNQPARPCGAARRLRKSGIAAIAGETTGQTHTHPGAFKQGEIEVLVATDGGRGIHVEA